MEGTDCLASPHDEILDEEQVVLIVHEVFDHFQLERPQSVEFESPPIDTNEAPSIKKNSGVLIIRAASEVEARKVIAKFAIRKKWPWHKWMLADQLGRSILSASVLYVIIILLGVFGHWMLGDSLNLQWTLVIILILTCTVFLAFRMPQWSETRRRDLQSLLSEVNAIAEYDGEYTFYDYSIIVGLGYLCGWILTSIIALNAFFQRIEVAFPIVVGAAILAFLSMGISSYMMTKNEKKFDRCFEYQERSIFNDENPRGVDSPEADELRRTALEIAQKLELEGFESVEGGGTLPIELAYHEVSWPMCRNCDYSFEDDRVLFDIRDTSLEAAKRELASTLVFREVVAGRSIGNVMSALLCGILLPIVLILAYLFWGVYTIVFVVLSAILFAFFNERSMRDEAQTRIGVRSALERTGLYTARLLTIYSGMTFSKSRKFEIQFAVGVGVLYALIMILMVVCA